MPNSNVNQAQKSSFKRTLNLQHFCGSLPWDFYCSYEKGFKFSKISEVLKFKETGTSYKQKFVLIDNPGQNI